MPPPETDTAQWFADEVQPHEAQLRSYLKGSFPRVRDVEDVVQESYVRMWRIRAQQKVRSAKGLLFQIARHVALDLVRRDVASPIDHGVAIAAATVAEDSPDAANSVAMQERRKLLVRAVAALPDRCREVVLLRKFEDVPQKEVAQRLGISERTVENLVARGIKKCEAYIRRHSGGEF